jgi:tetratricopeptide (TPR) repeat protein
MKKIFLYSLVPWVALFFLSRQTATPRIGTLTGKVSGGREWATTNGDLSLSCAPPAGLAELEPDAAGRYAPVFPGWGHYHYKVSTASDSAQFYFDQGLSLYYGYHLTEALASFKEAAREDSNCVMAHWGQALAMGPYYNNTYYYKMPPAVLPVLARMNRLAALASPKEQDLIRAMNRRYDADTADSHRIRLNRTYSEGIQELIGKYPDDPDIKALYVDGVMIEHAWDLWDDKGVAKPWTLALIKYCEDILAGNPLHPAALHYHIHLVEASLHPEAALHSADVLQELMPGVPHMVHMASHMYQRNGLYEKGVAINDRANAAQHYYDSIAQQLKLGSAVIHFDAVEAFCAFNAGMYRKGMQSANLCRQILAGNPGALSRRTYSQYLYMMPLFTLVRLGKWQEILELPLPDSSQVYGRLLSDFGRGLALLRTGKAGEASDCLATIHRKITDSVLTIRRLPNNAPIEGARVAEGILAGEIFFANQRYGEAMDFFYEAIQREDRMSYGEPKDWPLPVRHYAGACLLKLNKPEQAEKIYREDLALNPGNGWALLGLYQSLQAQHKTEAAGYKKKYGEAFAAAEEVPTASAY